MDLYSGDDGGGAYIRGAYIRDVNWLTYLGAYIWGEAYIRGIALTGFCGLRSCIQMLISLPENFIYTKWTTYNNFFQLMLF